MIDVRFKVVGEAEVVRVLREAPGAIRSCVIETFVDAGNKIVAEASQRAPFNPNRKAGTHLRDAVHFRIDNPAGNPRLYVTPYTRDTFHPHLLERGVERQQVKVYRKVYASKLQAKYTQANGKAVWRYKRPNRVKNRSTLIATRWHQLKAQPYFYPAVQSVGDVTELLQAAVNKAAAVAAKKGGAGAEP